MDKRRRKEDRGADDSVEIDLLLDNVEAVKNTLIVDYVAGKTFGDMDLYVNGSVAGIECQLTGTEI